VEETPFGTTSLAKCARCSKWLALWTIDAEGNGKWEEYDFG
jgi:hypothetical protein